MCYTAWRNKNTYYLHTCKATLAIIVPGNRTEHIEGDSMRNIRQPLPTTLTNDIKVRYLFSFSFSMKKLPIELAWRLCGSPPPPLPHPRPICGFICGSLNTPVVPSHLYYKLPPPSPSPPIYANLNLHTTIAFSKVVVSKYHSNEECGWALHVYHAPTNCNVSSSGYLYLASYFYILYLYKADVHFLYFRGQT